MSPVRKSLVLILYRENFVIEGYLPRASARRIPTLVVLVADGSSETDEGGEAGESAKAGR